MKCVHCGTEVQSPYCPACGQRAGVKRLTFRDVFNEMWNSLAGFDGILLSTLKDLTVRPGEVARSYIAGVRVKYFGPIGYFFFMITLLLLWVSLLGMDFAELIRDRQEAMAFTDPNREDLAQFTQWIGDHIKWFLFCAVPFEAFAARYFFFRRSGYNFIEHTVPLFYTMGHLFWLTMVVVLARNLTGTLYSSVTTVLTLAYFGFLYASLMRYQSPAKAFLKGIGVYVAGQVLFVLVLTVLIILVVLAVAVFNPDALESFRSLR